ncbi:hypothetical protein QFC22_005430 [Naganishia vaughanmartiniae]|uniref:Uncharacterized protein n=1 Tax=Naganishia vaughanmartiniae TaxID=1424756 RepID=A0ACC2WUL5_9TREE|nr:hypothetical protein QFC22_005430 [Naganishia vaughanmartiniae]
MQTRQQNSTSRPMSSNRNYSGGPNPSQRGSQQDADAALNSQMSQMGLGMESQQNTTRRFTGTSAADALRGGKPSEGYRDNYQETATPSQLSFNERTGPSYGQYADQSRPRGPQSASQGFSVDSAYLRQLQVQQAALIQQQQQQLELQRAQQVGQQVQAQQQTLAIQIAMQALNQKVVQAQNLARINGWNLDEAIHHMGGFTQNELDLLKLAAVREQQAKELASLQVLQAQIQARQQQMQFLAQNAPLGFGSASFSAGLPQDEESYLNVGRHARNTIDPSLPLPTAENNLGSAMEQRLAAKQQIEANLRARSEIAQAYGNHRQSHSRGQSMSKRTHSVDPAHFTAAHPNSIISPPPSSSSYGSINERGRGPQRDSSISPPPPHLLTPPLREPSDNETTPQNPARRTHADRPSGDEQKPAYNAFNTVFGNSVSPPNTAGPVTTQPPGFTYSSQPEASNKSSRSDSPTSVASATQVPSRRSPSTGSSSVDEVVLRTTFGVRHYDAGVIGQGNNAPPVAIVLRQPLGPPGSADELGNKNFASR